MEEVIKYFESLEARIAALEAQVEELKNRPEPEPKVVEKVVEVEKIVEKPVEVIKEPELPAEPQPEQKSEQKPESKPEPEQPKEVASPNASIYGKAVDDIRQAISLGDRFLYQRELFNQNAELMQRTLTELNALSSFDEAMEYISRFHWDAESSTYQQFIVTLHRRFG